MYNIWVLPTYINHMMVANNLKRYFNHFSFNNRFVLNSLVHMYSNKSNPL